MPIAVARAALRVCLAVVVPFAATAQTLVPSFPVTGRIAVAEPHSCDSGIFPDYGFTNSTVSWTECHALKHHMDALGSPITSNVFEPDARRPLQMTVDVEVRCVYSGSGASDADPIAAVRTQSDSAGFFNAVVPRSACGDSSEPSDGVLVIASALMMYEARDAAGASIGIIRGLWDRAAGSTVYSSVLPPEPTVWTSGTNEYIVPRFLLAYQVLPANPGGLALGDITFFVGDARDHFSWLRGALGGWQTQVNLHASLQAALAVDAHDYLYPLIFDPTQPGCPTRCYWWFFQPAPDGLWTYLAVATIGSAAHEFGHLIHFSMAPRSSHAYDPAWVMGRDTSGRTTYSRQVLNDYDKRQTQDMGFALVEGFADAMGGYFLNACRTTPAERWEAPDPRLAWLNPSYYAACDAYDDCPYRNFRFQMTERGILEGSDLWNKRVDFLSDLAAHASAAGATMVSSNSESKVRNFLCDVLDDDADVAYAAGRIGGLRYVQDYGWHAAERVDGRRPGFMIRRYAMDPPPETVRLTLGTLIEALAAFVPAGSYPGLPSPIVDGANRPYDDVRMSVDGLFSMQSFSAFLVRKGLATREQMNGILSGNRMEEMR
jgi:hypothetical protein